MLISKGPTKSKEVKQIKNEKPFSSIGFCCCSLQR
jgi:hypothetical protein